MSLITVGKLQCYQCGNKFPVNLNHRPDSIDCPYCQNTVPEDMINDILEAASAVVDLNRRLLKYHFQRDENLFGLEVTPQEVDLPVDNKKQYPQ